MSESEETKTEQEQNSSSGNEQETPSFEFSELLSETEPTQVAFSETEPPKEAGPDTPPLQKVELKKHALLAPHLSPAPTADSVSEPALSRPAKESDPRVPEVGMEVEIDVILDRKRISLTALSTLAEGEVLTLSGADFRATLFLQEKSIAEAELVMVDQRPSLQITKVFSVS